jgi:predicted HicB family RNase H-like nuclease
MEYKGYTGKVEYDDEAGIFYGEVVGLMDVVTFRGSSVKELKKSFKESIDDYLNFCKRMGKTPDVPASGRLILRIPAEIHSRAAVIARTEGRSLNTWVTDAVREKLSEYSANPL